MCLSEDNDYPRNLKAIRQTEFPTIKDVIYMDHAGSTLYSHSQISEYTKDLLSNVYGNPHSGNPSSELTSDAIYQTRGEILNHFNTNNKEYKVIFTSGATGAIKIVAESFNWSEGASTFWYLEDNHTSVVGIRESAHAAGASSICLSLNKASKTADAFTLKNYNPILVKKAKLKVPATSSTSHLFAYPGQSNFSGCKYPLKWIDDIKCNEIPKSDIQGKWFTLLDASSLVSTSSLNLNKHAPDFVCISFYKMFGFPTGLGALLVKKDAAAELTNKIYFGGGTADGYLATSDYYKPRVSLHSRFEDGSLPFLNIIALRHGFNALSKITKSISIVQNHTFLVAKRLYLKMNEMRYLNNNPLVHIYSYSNFKSTDAQGPIVCFNLKRMDKSYIGFNHVLQLAASKNIHLRSGCFCNVGACCAMLDLQPNHLEKVYESGHVCGDHVDLINGQPVGAVRLSLGYMSTNEDADYFLEFLEDSFLKVEESFSSMKNEVHSTNCNHSIPNQIYLKKIFVYPVKSCRPMEVSSWDICETGLKYDRQWMVVGEFGVCWTLKRQHRMTLIKTWIDLKKSTLTLSSDEFGSVQVPSELDQNSENLLTCQSKVCGEKIVGYNCGSKVNDWLTKVIGKKAVLIRKQSGAKRFSKNKVKSEKSETISQPLSLSNEAQFLMVSETTVEYLQKIINKHNMSEDCLLVEDAKFPGKSENYLDTESIIARFRCNFLISGAAPFTEESWSKVVIKTENNEQIELKCTGLCNRCSMVCIDHNTGERGIEPLRTLGTLPPPGNQENTKQRRNQFGVYLYSNDKFLQIKCGAQLSVLQKCASSDN